MVAIYTPSLMPSTMELVEGVTTRDSLTPAAWQPFDRETAFKGAQSQGHGGAASEFQRSSTAMTAMTSAVTLALMYNDLALALPSYCRRPSPR